MNKYCPYCGNELIPGSKFCDKCGANQERKDGTKTTQENEVYMDSRPKIVKRDLVMAILLSVLTCGIYSLYWLAVMTDEVNRVSDDYDISGGLAVLLTLLTCGLFGIYWTWKLGQKLYSAGQKYGVHIEDKSILYLILTLFQFGFVSYILIQDDLNKFAL